MHGRINEPEKGDAREPGIIYNDWKHFLDQAAGLEPEKAENRNSQILLSVMREFLKERDFRSLTEKVMSQARLLPERWEKLTYEQKIWKVWHPEPLLSYLKQESLAEKKEEERGKAAHRPPMEKDSLQENEEKARGQKEGEILEQPGEMSASRDPGEREHSGPEIFENLEKPEGTKTAAAAKMQLLERIVRVQKDEKLWERIQKEYRSETEAYVQKIQEQNGTVPEEMKPVLGKGPFLSAMEGQEEIVEAVAGLFYEIPELKMYAKGLAEEKDRGKKQEQLGEVIANLNLSEWKLLESKVFEKSGAKEKGRAGQENKTGQEGKTGREGKTGQEGKTGREGKTGQEDENWQAVKAGQLAGARPVPGAKNGTDTNVSGGQTDRFAASSDLAFLPAEYQKKKEQIADQILKASGKMPEGMEAVLGKLPLIQLVEESEETAEYVSRLLYEMPEMEIYTRLWQKKDAGRQPETQIGADKAGKAQAKAVEILVELIETLSPGEWKLLERRLLRETEEAGEKGKTRSGAGLERGAKFLAERREESPRGNGEESLSGAMIKFLPEDEGASEAGLENLPTMSNLEYRNLEKVLLREKDMPEDGYQGSAPLAAAAMRLNLPDTVSLEFLRLISQDFQSDSQIFGDSRRAGNWQTSVNPQISGNWQKSPNQQVPGNPQRSESRQISGNPEMPERLRIFESPKAPESLPISGGPQIPESLPISGNPQMPGSTQMSGSPQVPEMLLLSGAADGQAEERTFLTSGVPNDMAAYPGAAQVFKEKGIYAMLQESGIYAADRMSPKSLELLRTPEIPQMFGPPEKEDSMGHAVSENDSMVYAASGRESMRRDVSGKGSMRYAVPGYDFPGYDSGIPVPDRVIARTLPPRGMESPVQDAPAQLRFLQEQPAGKLSEDDIHTVQVMGNKVRTANEYEERLTTLTEQITAQKAEIDELMQNNRKLSDPRRQQRVIERMMKQLRGQIKLERLQRGND